MHANISGGVGEIPIQIQEATFSEVQKVTFVMSASYHVSVSQKAHWNACKYIAFK